MLPNPHELAAVRESCAASFIFIIYDFFLTLDDEIEIMWPKSMRSWVKWKFLFLRYFAIAVQLINFSIEGRITPFDDSESSGSMDLIYGFLIAQVVTCFVISAVVESMLMIRIYAIYNKNLYIAFGCALLLVGQFAAMSICIAGKVETRNAINAIDVETLSGSFPYLGISTLVSQGVIVALTVIKHYEDVRQGTRSSVMTLLLRDGILAFLASTFITCLTVVTIIYGSVYAVVSYFWLISILASLGCRIMINLERYWKPLRTLFEPTSILTELSFAFYGESNRDRAV